MANQPRDWDKEMAKIDRLIAAQAGPAQPPARREPAPASATPQAKAPTALPSSGSSRRWSVWGRVLLGVVLGVAVTQWPNAHACGTALVLYLGAVTAVVLAGAWGAVTAWRRRFAAPHVLSLALIAWGLALGAREVLPRVGYARQPLTWLCP